jgi:hypothetical protein
LGPGEDGGEFSYRVLSEDGEILSAAGGIDPFRCYECKASPAQEDFQYAAPLIRGMAFFEILDLRFNKVVLLFDMRGFVQVFCMNNPCVDICQPESVDGGSGEAGVTILDAGIGEAAGGGVMDASVK